MLTVNEQSISLSQALRYLQGAGKLQQFLADILRPYVIDQELESRTDISATDEEVQQAIINFRLQQQLNDQQKFEQWLQRSGLNYPSFQAEISKSIKREKLRQILTAPQLEAYFLERKLYLDSVVLSRIVVTDKELADTLYRNITKDKISFEQLAKQHSITDDRNFNGMMGAVSIGTLPDAVRVALNSALIGEIVGPLEIDGYWCLFRYEEAITASLENPKLKQRLQNELFERWLAATINQLQVKLDVKD